MQLHWKPLPKGKNKKVNGLMEDKLGGKIEEDQGERQIKALEVHGKQLHIYSNEKVSSTHSKQKEIFEELADKKI